MELSPAALALAAALGMGPSVPAAAVRPLPREAGACPAVGFGRLRPDGADLSNLIHRGCTLSPTFNALVDRLGRSDLIVVVRFGRCSNGVAGCLHFLGPANGSRNLRVTVDRFGRPEWQILALVAHEMQHTLELADAADAKDVDAFQRVFARIGWRGGAGFETAQAVAIQRIVLKEVTTRRGR